MTNSRPYPKKSPSIPRSPAQQSPSAFASQFNATPIQNHTHNGADAPRVNYNDLINKPTSSGVYGGNVLSAGNVLPTGWTSAYADDTYTVTHNLGTTKYTAVCVPQDAQLGVYLTINENNFQVSFSNGSIYFESDFNFVVVIIS